MNVRGAFANLIDATLEASVVGSYSRIGYAVRSRLERWGDPVAVGGRHVLVTGGTSGIGFAIARRLGRLGANVTIVGRDPQRVDDAVARLRANASGAVEGRWCDVGDFAAVRNLVESFAPTGRRFDVVIHNAGALSATYAVNPQGVENTVAVHLLGPYVLTEHLLARGLLAPRARIITMASAGMYTQPFELDNLELSPTDYRGAVAYARAKRAQCVLTTYWQATYGQRDLAFHVVHPGWVATPGLTSGLPGFARLVRPLLRRASQGADTTVWLAGLPDFAPTPGLFWFDRHPRSYYRMRSTRRTPEEERRDGVALAAWCAARTGSHGA